MDYNSDRPMEHLMQSSVVDFGVRSFYWIFKSGFPFDVWIFKPDLSLGV